MPAHVPRGPRGDFWAGWWAGGAAGLLIVCVVGCLEGFLAERLTWKFRGFKGGKGPSLGVKLPAGLDGGPRKGGAQAEGGAEKEPGGWKTQRTFGEHPVVGMVPHSSAFGLALPTLFSLGSAPPHPKPTFCLLGTCPSSETLGGTRGDQDIASTFDRAGGSRARCPSGSAPPAPAPGKLGEDMVWGPASSFVWREPHLQLWLHQSRSKGQSPLPAAAVLQSSPCGQDFGVQGRSPSTGVRSQNPEGSQASALNGC